jgi:NAD-dependent SIR2 family protein deacetylase
MKCSKCGNKIEETFLGKIKGTYVKKEPICDNCQKTPQ